jgi:hypothetical protein
MDASTGMRKQVFHDMLFITAESNAIGAPLHRAKATNRPTNRTPTNRTLSGQTNQTNPICALWLK